MKPLHAASRRRSEVERDALTGALSRQTFLSVLEREVLEAAEETRGRFALCLADVDELRKVNAQKGLRVGDAVLAGLADAIRQGLREPAWRTVPKAVARYDGDALAILLKKPPRFGSVAELAERFSGRMGAAEFIEGTRVSVSVAVVRHEPGESLDELLARLELTLHVCKQFGRGRVELAPMGGWERAVRLRAAAS